MANEVLTQDLTTTWVLLSQGKGTYINNGSESIYVQRNSVEAPVSADVGFLVTMAGQFFVDLEQSEKTYVRTVSGTTTIARV